MAEPIDIKVSIVAEIGREGLEQIQDAIRAKVRRHHANYLACVMAWLLTTIIGRANKPEVATKVVNDILAEAKARVRLHLVE